MRHKNDRGSIPIDAIEQRGDLLPGLVVELAGGLVGKEQGRTIGKRS